MEEKQFIVMGNAFIPGNNLHEVRKAFIGFGISGTSHKHDRFFEVNNYGDYVYVEFTVRVSLTEKEIKAVIKEIETAVEAQEGEVLISVYYLVHGLGSVKSEEEKTKDEIEDLRASLDAYTAGLKALRKEVNSKITQLSEKAEMNRVNIEGTAKFSLHRTNRNRNMIYRLYELLGIEELVPNSESEELSVEQAKKMLRLYSTNPLKTLLKGVTNEDNK